MSSILSIAKQPFLLEWNRTAADYPQDVCLQQLFEAQVARTPGNVAVVYEDQSLTYDALNRKANQVAHTLRAHGIGPDTLVGICMERSFEMVIGLLGILKAGSAYVPLDPDYPKDRLAFMLEDAAVPVLLTQQALVDHLPSHQAAVLCLDSDWGHIAKASDENPEPITTAGHLAYVIYTSGSTGKPKGVMVAHSAICNHLFWMQEHYPLTEHDSVMQKTPFSFDPSVWEFHGPLMQGARLVMARPGGHADSAYLVDLIRQQHITVMEVVPSLIQVLLDEPGIEACHSLKHVFSGGELLPSELIKRFYAKTRAHLYNQYGPTETTINATLWDCSEDIYTSKAPIGRPIANTRIYLLDEHLTPVPAGVAGEMYIGGAGLARGYLNRPELTAERFVPDPFSDDPKARLYKTGDLARYLPDGTIDFIGRIDHQVKLRGFRIELGEIESVLTQHPTVREAVVMLREDSPGDKHLVAYVVTHAHQAISPQVYRQYLKAMLPDFMLPSAYVFMEQLPLTPNGKVDRNALPTPDHIRPELNNTYIAPRTSIEKTLVDVWEAVLGVNKIGIYDNFFELGGHSLLVARLIMRLHDAIGVQFSYNTIFNAPTVSLLAEVIEHDPLRQACMPPPVHRYHERQSAPLSYGQEDIWMAVQLHPDLPVYNEAFTIHIPGPIETEILQQSLNELIIRHDSLRTAFKIENGQPVQSVCPDTTFKLTVTDLRSLPDGEREQPGITLATEDAQQPFELSMPPLMRARIVLFNDSDCRLYLVLNHIVLDAVSVYNIFVPELEALYKQLLSGKQPPLRQSGLHYIDYAAWQREWLQHDVLDTHLSYWKKQLEGILPLELPTDRPRPPVQSFSGTYQTLIIPATLTQELNTLSRRQGVTLYMLLLAAFKTLLWRYTRQDDLVVGTVDAGRARAELESILGYFLNMLVIRTDLSGNLTFEQLLQRVRQTMLEAYDHKHMPLGKLIEAIHPQRDPARQPLFQVAFVMEPTMPGRESDWSISQLELQTGTSKFDLTIELEERNGDIIGRMEYNTDLFEAATIERMLGHYHALLNAIVTDPGQRIAKLPLFGETERQRLLVEWNRTAADYPQDVCLQQLFEAQVARTPGNVAVVCEDQSLTYDALNRKANQVAHTLRAHGIGPDTLVGICMERSFEMVIGLLGILKAGSAYVPLDPDYPKDRLAFMLEDAAVPVLLTQQALVDHLPSHQAAVLCLDSDWGHIAKASDENPEPITTAGHLAYVIYTSGSTGKPKGVMVAHSAICNHLFWMQEHYPLTEHDSVMQKTPFSFDPSVWEFHGPLMQGARLVMARPGGHADSAYLVDLIRQQHITVMEVVPSLIQVLLDEPGIEACHSLKHVFSGGELLPSELIKRFYAKTRAHLYNQYGPTETTINATLWDCSEDIYTSKAPIGRPIANTRIYLLDEHLTPVPAGVAGEMYIGGAGLARGYLNRPELTAERFVPDPFSDDPKARLYKTGDLARYLPDGTIDFIGRIDHQVKLRGFRIELGEIESVLTQHPTVREAVVMLREDSPGDKRLAAYIIKQKEELAARTLQQYLKGKLPEYMVPASYVFMEQLPLLPSGKVDRKALPAPVYTAMDKTVTSREPKDILELQLINLWEELLDVLNITVHDNFFDLGGHSLLAIRMVSQIEQIFGKKISVATVFETPTIEGLASALRTNKVSLSETGLIPLRTGGTKAPFFCVYGNAQELVRHMDKDQPVYWFWSRHQTDSSRFSPTASMEDIAANYLKEIRRIQPHGPYLLGGYCVGGTLAYEIARQLNNNGQEVAFMALIDPFRPGRYGLYDRLNYELGNIEKVAGVKNKLTHIIVTRGITQIKRKITHYLQRFKFRSSEPERQVNTSEQKRLYIHPLAAHALKHYKPLPCNESTALFMPGLKRLLRKKGGYMKPPAHWARLLRGKLETYYVPEADHDQLFEEPYVREIARQINEHLRNYQETIKRHDSTR